MRIGEGQSPCLTARCWLSSTSAGQGICCELELSFSRACCKHAQFKSLALQAALAALLKHVKTQNASTSWKEDIQLDYCLMALERSIGSPNFRIGLVIGTRYGDPGDVRFCFRQQITTLNNFRKGEINCLVSFWRLRQLVSALITAACNFCCRRGTRYPRLQHGY